MAEPTMLHLTAAVSREGDWYVARCLDIEATSQGQTVEEAIANLRRGGGLPRRGAGTFSPISAPGHLVRRARPGVTGRLPRGVSGKQAVAALERAGFVPVRGQGL
jgi:hypothetical protein